jgi:hypothetical protein
MLGACADHAPARIVFADDTIHVNTTLWTDPGVSAVNAAGERIAHAVLTFRATPESLVVVSPDGATIRCREDGIGRLEARVNALYAARTVDCHLARSFSPVRVYQLRVGGPPARFHITAYDRDGRAIVPLHIPVRVQDPDVLRLDRGLVYALKPGGSSVGACSGTKCGGDVVFVATGPPARSGAESLPDAGPLRR